VCQAYVLRKNRNRTEVDGRLKTGHKIDGLFHELNDRQVEYGVMESARRLNAVEVSTKWQSCFPDFGGSPRLRAATENQFVNRE
jgi:mannose-1-phosphate guanylyltransferase